MKDTKWTFKLRSDQVITVIACLESARSDVSKEHLNSDVARKVSLRQIDDLLVIFRDVGVKE